MMRISRVLGLCIFVGVTGVGSISRAGDDPLSDTARELFVKGVKAYEHGRWEQCRAALLAAYAIKRHAQIAGNLADCELKLGKNRDAAEHAWFFLQSLRPEAPAERKAGAQAQFKEAQQKVVTLRITVDVASAEVLVDGQSVGKAPLDAPVFVDPGRHTIEALRTEGSASLTVEVRPGESRDLALVLKKTQGASGSGGVSKPIILGGAAVTGAALVTGAILAIVAHHKATDADTKLAGLKDLAGTNVCQANAAACEAIDSDRAARDRLANASTGVFIGAGLVGAATLGYALLSPRSRPATGRVQVVPTFSARDAGLMLVGAW